MAQCLVDLLCWDIQDVGQLLRCGATLVSLLELCRLLADLVEQPYLIERQAYVTRLLGQSLQYGLANPPHGIADKLESASLVESLCSLEEPDVAFVDEIR